MIQEGVAHGEKAGYTAESEGFAKLSQTNESKALIGLFEGRTHCKKNRFGNPQRPPKLVLCCIHTTQLCIFSLAVAKFWL